MVIYILWILILLLFIFLYLTYYGIFNPIILHEIEFGPIKYFYKEYQGSYGSIGPTYDRIKRIAFRTFKEIQLFSIYYDDPNTLIDSYEGRALLGFYSTDEQDNINIDKFVKTNGFDIKYIELPLISALYTRFPYRSYLSFHLIASRVRKKMTNFLKKNKNIQFEQGEMPLIEEFHFKNNYIDIIIPYGPEYKSYIKTNFSKPKNKIMKKMD